MLFRRRASPYRLCPVIVLECLVVRHAVAKLRSTAVPILAVSLAWTAACGGSSAPAQAADGVSERSARTEHGTDHEEGDSDSGSTETAESTAPASNCENGTCFACGAGFCLSGWYCDEGAPGGAACSWIPDCATKATCGCIGKVLGSGCSCKEDNGGPHVSCG